MAKNPHAHHELDSAQIDKRVFDPANDANRVVLADLHSMSISLSSSEDSITSVPTSLAAKGSSQVSDSIEVILPIPCIGMKSFQLVLNGSEDVVGGECSLSVSPSDSDDVWVVIQQFSIAPKVMASSPVNALGRRLKVQLSTPLTQGSLDAYVMAQSV
jgi:hypothetical protein